MNSNPEEEFSGLTFIQDDNNDLTCEAYETFCEALDTLYLMKNLSGRLNFLEQWPVAAAHIFGDELIQYDREGTKDLERRAVLEEEAEDRRIALLELAQDIPKKSVLKGVLQVEYVEETFKNIGRDMALLIYSERIVNRFMPLDTAADVAVDAGEEEALESSAVAAVPQNPVSNIPDDIDIEGLELGQPTDDMASLNTVGKTEDDDGDARPRRGAFAPVKPADEQVVDKSPEPEAQDVEEKSKPRFDEYEDELDGIQPISVGNDMPADAQPLPPEPIHEQEKKPDGPPMSPEESEYFRPNQWSNEGAPGAGQADKPAEIKNDAMSGIKVSQKMTFRPEPKEGDEKEPPKPAIPVIGGTADKPQDDG